MWSASTTWTLVLSRCFMPETCQLGFWVLVSWSPHPSNALLSPSNHTGFHCFGRLFLSTAMTHSRKKHFATLPNYMAQPIEQFLHVDPKRTRLSQDIESFAQRFYVFNTFHPPTVASFWLFAQRAYPTIYMARMYFFSAILQTLCLFLQIQVGIPSTSTMSFC